MRRSVGLGLSQRLAVEAAGDAENDDIANGGGTFHVFIGSLVFAQVEEIVVHIGIGDFDAWEFDRDASVLGQLKLRCETHLDGEAEALVGVVIHLVVHGQDVE